LQDFIHTQAGRVDDFGEQFDAMFRQIDGRCPRVEPFREVGEFFRPAFDRTPETLREGGDITPASARQDNPLDTFRYGQTPSNHLCGHEAGNL
jgi:hypothetical protein